ncbi:hypothetical protein BD0136_01290 [Helicobacter pylori]
MGFLRLSKRTQTTKEKKKNKPLTKTLFISQSPQQILIKDRDLNYKYFMAFIGVSQTPKGLIDL